MRQLKESNERQVVDVTIKGDSETHPSYGVVNVYRVSSNPAQRVFGSDGRFHEVMCIEISEASIRRSLSQEWIHADKSPVIRIRMTDAQYGHMFGSVGQGSGTPCTIERLNYAMVPEAPEPPAFTTKFSSDIKDTMAESVSKLTAIIERLNDANKPGAKVPGKKELAEIMSNLEMALRGITGSLEFVENSFNEQMQDKIDEARQAIQSYVRNLLEKRGLEAYVAQAPGNFLGDGGEDKQ
jgi:hypothetical protein